MRFMPFGPGRVNGPFLDPGDQVALAHRHGTAVGEWVSITRGLTRVSLVVPEQSGPVSKWLARDSQGRIQWWSDTVWQPALQPGDTAHLPIPVSPSAGRIPHPRPEPEPRAQLVQRAVPDPTPELVALLGPDPAEQHERFVVADVQRRYTAGEAMSPRDLQVLQVLHDTGMPTRPPRPTPATVFSPSQASRLLRGGR